MTPPAEPSFLAFAQVHLGAARRGEVDVVSAFATYRAFCRRTGRSPLSRTNFGAALLALARPLGGCRSGETITALALRDAVPAPACEAIRAVAPPAPPPSAERLNRPLPSLLVDRPSRRQPDPAMRRRYDFEQPRRGNRQPDAPAPPARQASVACVPASPITPADPVAEFLARRLIEAPGFVVALESLREAALAEDLKFSDILDRAKARGHGVRRNAWGPDFLTDAQLVAAEDESPAREAAE